ncbi:MAG: aminotransferase class I/II-fold pyridoxal phosphate-dependent enzyme [Clostridiaceae bacterium]|jgi:8-amino-7-oxononanoate synthase|nr:aminotransferase class I/II-fold pyridoxal phosphate-dependent enzyme [Clostridiaceae bacterium]
MDIFEKCYSYTDHKEAIAAGLYPYFHALETGQDTEVVIEGRKTVMVGSNNYLGLTSDPRVKEAAIEAVREFGSGCSGSRFLNGTLTLHLELEKKLAEFVKKEAALTFSTGFQTNLGIITAIAGRNDYILCDSDNHASIVDGCRLSFAKTLKFEHNNMDDLERLLSKIDDKYGKLIVVDGIFSMEGDIADLPSIVKLAKKFGARVMVDDAHSFGVLGEHGRGTAEHFGLEDEVDIIMSTFSKSLASLGGFVAGKQDVIDYIKHNSRPFIFSASIPPANAAAAIAALEIIKAEPERIQRLRDISSYMRQGFRKMGIPIYEANSEITPIVPVMTYENEPTLVVTKLLREEGVYVNPVLSPAVKPGFCRIRTSYTATHTQEQLDYALEAFRRVFEKLGTTAG